MSDNTYRAGVIGLGVVGNIADGLGGRHPILYRPCSHADAYVFHPQTELIAGSTRDPKRQMIFREKHENLPVYKDYRQLLESEELDIVSIATPATCHAEMVIAAAEAGTKGIYCEKAMATSLAECDAMIAACEKSGTVLAINHLRRWDDRIRALKKQIDEGTIGELQSIQISFGGGRLCRRGSHLFDLALLFCADEVTSGCGWLSDPEAFDPSGVGLFETRRGIRIIVDGALGMNHPLQVDLIGDNGMIRIVDGGFELELWTMDESSEFGQMAKRHLPMNFPVRNPMLNILDDLVHCMKSGGQPLDSGYDGRNAFEMIAAIHQSHEQNRRFIPFPLQDRERIIPSN